MYNQYQQDTTKYRLNSTHEFITLHKSLITKNLSQKDVSKLAVRSVEFPEITFSMSKKRVYPQGIIAGHITGYTGIYSKSDNTNKKFVSLSFVSIFISLNLLNNILFHLVILHDY